MLINLSPVAGAKTTSVSLSGLTLTIDGVTYDLSAIPAGGQAEGASDSPFIGFMTRDAVTILYEYDSKAAEPYQSTDWADYTFDIAAGAVPCPIKWKQMELVE